MSHIDWNYPEPRKGYSGVLDRFVGPGATRAELTLQFALPLAAAVFVLGIAATEAADWTVLQLVVAGFMAFDLVGGIFTNATSSAKRWYHRPGQTRKDHIGFIAIHLLHLSIVSWVFLGWNWQWVAVTGSYLVAATIAILGMPLYLQRPVSLSVFAGALLLGHYGVTSPIGLEWFLPLFYLKLLVSHLPKEEPYRPQGRNDK